jgi:hypothetical protein
MASREHSNIFAPRYGPSGKGASYNLNLRPFWICPRNLLPHNIYYASKIALVDSSFLNSNIVAASALLAASFYWENGPRNLLYLWGTLWLAWLINIPKGTRKLLSSPEISTFLEKEGKT